MSVPAPSTASGPLSPRPEPAADDLDGRARPPEHLAGRLVGWSVGWLRGHGIRLLLLADIVAVQVILVGLSVLRIGTATAETYPLWQYVLAFAVTAWVYVVALYYGGLYEAELRLGWRPLLPLAAGASFTATLLVATAELLLGRYYVPRTMLVVLPLLTALAIVGNHRWARRRARRSGGPPRVVLVGAAEDIVTAQTHLAEEHSPALVVGTVHTADQLLSRVVDAGASDVLLLDGALLDQLYPAAVERLERAGIGLYQRIAGRDTLLGLKAVREIAGMPFVVVRSSTLPRSSVQLKRSIELTALLLVLPAVAPLGLALVVYVRLLAGPGVLYRQRRVGLGGAPFTMLKFRTMRDDAEAGGAAVLAQPRDARVVPGLGWLRRTRLDELPQVINVLRGEMSVVGPRPERPELTAHYEAAIPGYVRRHDIPPGITGLAQIFGRYHTDPRYKLGHDLQYLVNWSPVLDMQILLRTVWVMLRGRV